ncbi:SMP-30/gluconolactonase/LRE family protein [Mesorhizobium shangrilense]|uniref:SMP-30/gluconolactonase/LRE family protein n=1 Tax=Mesorhizobium shangrilense TaxID=460060 RepID=A0ABV2DIE6_9HYPH
MLGWHSVDTFDLTFDFVEPVFKQCVFGGPRLERLFRGTRLGEGPVYFADLDVFIWSDIPNNRMLRYVEGQGTTIFRSPSNHANGSTRDNQGRLLTCEHSGRRVVRTEYDGSLTVLADRFEGRRLNSPNDVVVKSDGSIWFTDPSYGIRENWEGVHGEREQATCNIYRVDPHSGAVTMVADDCQMPNGLAFSLDEQKLYVTDTGCTEFPDGAHHFRVFDVRDDKRLGPSQIFAEVNPGLPDGFRLDTEGFIWTSAGDGVQCLAPNGDLVGRILVPEAITNLVFGGPRGDRLYLTGLTSLWSVYVNRCGAR